MLTDDAGFMPALTSSTRDGQKLLTQVKTLAAQHESTPKQKFGAEHYRVPIETPRDF